MRCLRFTYLVFFPSVLVCLCLSVCFQAILSEWWNYYLPSKNQADFMEQVSRTDEEQYS